MGVSSLQSTMRDYIGCLEEMGRMAFDRGLGGSIHTANPHGDVHKD